MPTVSIVIPSLNSRTVRGVVEALSTQTSAGMISEIVVVGLDEPGVLQSDPRVRFISTGHPVCAAAARNIGLRAAQSEVLIVLDADCFPQPNWLARLLTGYALGRAVIGGGITFARDNYWLLADNLSMFHEFTIEQPPKTCRYLPTSNLLLTRQVWNTVGGMDESFPGASGEDIDWTIRMRLAGFELYFEPAAQVMHRPARATLRDIWRHGWWAGRNMSRVRRRYPAEYPSNRLLRQPSLLLVFSPAIALVPTLRLVWQTRRPWRDWLTLPAIYATKLAWVLGAVREAISGSANTRLLRRERRSLQ